mgnify:CR=1 FL=1
MERWSGTLFDESQTEYALESPNAMGYCQMNVRQPHAPWLPIRAPQPAEGILIAICAIHMGIPFLFLEPDEDAEHYDALVEDAYNRHRNHVEPIGIFSRSSGSSGRVKLIPRTLNSWLSSFEAHRDAFNLDRTNAWLILGNTGFSATVYHGLLGLFYGKRIYLQGSLSPSTTLQLIQTCSIDTLLSVPTRFGLLLKTAARKACEESSASPLSIIELPMLYSLKTVITVGEVLSHRVNQLATTHLPFAKLWHYYGAAELGQVAFCSYHAQALEPQLLGQPFKGVSVEIDSEGNILVHSPYLAMDYQAPATVYDKGYLSSDLLYFKGRVDLQFNRHGKKYNLEDLHKRLSKTATISAFWIERLKDPNQDNALEAYQLHLLVEVARTEDHCERLEFPAAPSDVQSIGEMVQGWCKSYFSPKALLIYHEAAHTSGGKMAWHKMHPDLVLKR